MQTFLDKKSYPKRYNIMKLKIKTIISVFIVSLIVVNCQHKSNTEDKESKLLLQGIWMVDDGSSIPAMLVRGDSIFYPDSASMPISFWITNDSIYLKGNSVISYKIIKQTNNIFRIVNLNGDEVKFIKSNTKELFPLFEYHPYAMNTFEKSVSDTIVRTTIGFLHSKINIETTSDKVIKSSCNDNGIEVESTYLDNVAKLLITNNNKIIYSHSFRKVEFSNLIEQSFLKKSILSNFEFAYSDGRALYYNILIGIPDASTSYVVRLRISTDGKTTMRMG